MENSFHTCALWRVILKAMTKRAWHFMFTESRRLLRADSRGASQSMASEPEVRKCRLYFASVGSSRDCCVKA